MGASSSFAEGMALLRTSDLLIGLGVDWLDLHDFPLSFTAIRLLDRFRARDKSA